MEKKNKGKQNKTNAYVCLPSPFLGPYSERSFTGHKSMSCYKADR